MELRRKKRGQDLGDQGDEGGAVGKNDVDPVRIAEMLRKEQRESPNDEDNPFVTIASLIEEKTSIATLASAIEQEGIFTWDKYGRWGKASIDDENRALHLLEIYYKWEETPPEEQSHEESLSPMDRRGCSWDNEYYYFGWAEKALPDFTNITHKQVEASSRRGAIIKRKAPDAFAIALNRLLVEIAKRDSSIDITAMPGLKADLYELAKKCLIMQILLMELYLVKLVHFCIGQKDLM